MPTQQGEPIAHAKSIRARAAPYNGRVALSFSYRESLQEAARADGALHTGWRLLKGICAIALDRLPWRRRLRYGDIDFDCDFRVDTTWANVPLRTRFRELFAGRGYQPSDPLIFREMMQHLPVDARSFIFFDVGSGKGRALLLAADYPFRRIVGVELLPELHAIAQENVWRYHSPEQKCSNFELHCADARRFPIPAEALFVYLFDPFPESILREWLAQLEDSLRRVPRQALIGYQNPISEYVIGGSKLFRRIAGTVQWALYESISR